MDTYRSPKRSELYYECWLYNPYLNRIDDILKGFEIEYDNDEIYFNCDKETFLKLFKNSEHGILFY